jgi:pentose-5-phosphate-3-epimerase
MWALLNKQNKKIECVLLPMTPLEVVEKAKYEFDVVEITTENGPFIVGNIHQEKLEKEDNE